MAKKAISKENKTKQKHHEIMMGKEQGSVILWVILLRIWLQI